MVRFWVDCDWVHLSVGGQWVKSLRSRFSVNDLDALVARGALARGSGAGGLAWWSGTRSSCWQRRRVFEVERTVAKNGTVSLGNQEVIAAEILAGRRVGVHIEEGRPLLFFDLRTRELLRSRANPLGPRRWASSRS